MVPRNKMTVLVVEDDTLVRMYGVDVLSDAGFTVLEATTADEAMDLLQKNDGIHILFSDIDMPGSMDGLELAQRVQSRWPTIGLIVTSGQHYIEEAKLPQGGRFVRKPWTQDRLMATIDAAMGATD